MIFTISLFLLSFNSILSISHIPRRVHTTVRYSALTLEAENENSSPRVLRYLLSKEIQLDVNMRIIPKTLKWKIMRKVARVFVRVSPTKNISKFLQNIADMGGSTALHCAAKRGDAEIVEILLEHGANVEVKNQLGRDAMS